MATTRRATNLTIDASLIDEARALKVNVSRAAEAGIVQAIREQKARQWQQDNAGAIQSSNEWVDRHGLPLTKHRLF